MAKLIRNKIVRFVEYKDLNNKAIYDWHDEYIGTAGMLCIYISENRAPGKKYVYYYPNEPDEATQRYFYTTAGELTESDNLIILETNHRYVFEVGDYVSDADAALLMLNIYMPGDIYSIVIWHMGWRLTTSLLRSRVTITKGFALLSRVRELYPRVR